MELETERLRLRAALAKDIPFLLKAHNDWSLAQWFTSPPYPYTQTDAEWFVSWTSTADEKGLNGKFVIADRQTDVLLGSVTLVSVGEYAEFGYWLFPSAQKKGYMREAIRAVLGYAKEKFAHLSCQASIDPTNFDSEKCLIASGFAFIKNYQREKPRHNGSIEGKLYGLSW